MNNKVSILEVINDAFGTGGGGVQVWNWYRNIDLDKVQIDFFITANQKADEKYQRQYLDVINQNGKYYYSYFENIKNKKDKMKRLIVRMYQLHNITKNNDYDCIHLHGGGSFRTFLFYLVTKKNVKKVLVHSHITYTDDALKRYIMYLCRPFFRGKKIVYLACSEDAAKWLFPADIVSKRQYIILKNGIDIEKFRYDFQVRKRKRYQMNIDDKFVIGHVGRFAYQKNHTFLIDIFYQIHLRNSAAVLLLVGSGELEKNIREKADRLGLTKHIIFYGNTEEVSELYQAMDCFLFPSNFEGLGIVAIEAQAAGLKTLCSDVVPKEAQVTDLLEYMSLDEPVEKWASKILSYNDNYERKDVLKVIKQNGYDIKCSAKQLENIYLNCC